MRVREIHFDPAELPETVVVELSIDEAASVVQLIGPLSSNALLDRGFNPEVTSELYRGLVETVFNPYWENGVREVLPTTGPPG